MNQKIKCRAGQCFEDEEFEKQFDSLFDQNNIVEQIQNDLFKEMFR